MSAIPPPPPPPKSSNSKAVWIVAGLIVVALAWSATHRTASNSSTTPGMGTGLGGDALTHACNLVRYWGDPTGAVADPDPGVTTRDEVVALAPDAWPDDTGTAAEFVQLYDGLFSNASDADYDVQARAFVAAHCQ